MASPNFKQVPSVVRIGPEAQDPARPNQQLTGRSAGPRGSHSARGRLLCSGQPLLLDVLPAAGVCGRPGASEAPGDAPGPHQDAAGQSLDHIRQSEGQDRDLFPGCCAFFV